MDENLNDKLKEVDELLESTSNESRKRNNVSDININAEDFKSESKEISSNDIPESKDVEDVSSNIVDAKPVEKADEPIKEEKPQPKGPIKIVDETLTTLTIEEGPEISIEEINGTEAAAAKVKKPKEKVKLNALQIVIICFVSVITLWFIIFTVDHTLAANGLSPLFSFRTQEYSDGSQSFVGAGYKTQFQFDANGNLTQKCVPFWKDGPNDIKFESGNDAQANDNASFNQ